MLVSVVVPTLNRSHWLTACLAHLDAQRTTKDFEVVVVDNGSTDETPAVLDSWCAGHPRFRWHREPRVGRSRALNAGLRMTRGDLLLFTDDDTTADPGWIDAYARWYTSDPDRTAMAVGPILPAMTDLGAWPSWLPETALWDVPRLDHGAAGRLSPDEYGWGANLAIPAELFGALGGWNEEIGNVGVQRRHDFEDTEFQERVRAAGGSVWFCDHAIVHHRVPPDRLSPRAIVRSAHARGLDERRRVRVGARPVGTDTARSGGPVTTRRALGHAVVWPAYAAAFRARPSPRRFERLRHLAWCCGWNRTAVATEWTANARVVDALLVRSRRLAVRLTPTEAAPRSTSRHG